MMRKWADWPHPLISTPRKFLQGKEQTGAEKFATEMANVHNVLIRGLNSIILQAPNVTDRHDIKDFMRYAEIWCILIHEHHTNEEVFAFPLIEREAGKKGIMDKNVYQHESFSDGLSAYRSYVVDVLQDRATYDSERFLKLVSSFDEALVEHLAEEITSIVGLKQYDVNWDLTNEAITEYSVKSINDYRDIPFIMTHTDAEFEDGLHKDTWPPFPRVASLLGKHKDQWRFAPCDGDGNRRELEFA